MLSQDVELQLPYFLDYKLLWIISRIIKCIKKKKRNIYKLFWTKQAMENGGVQEIRKFKIRRYAESFLGKTEITIYDLLNLIGSDQVQTAWNKVDLKEQTWIKWDRFIIV